MEDEEPTFYSKALLDLLHRVGININVDELVTALSNIATEMEQTGVSREQILATMLGLLSAAKADPEKLLAILSTMRERIQIYAQYKDFIKKNSGPIEGENHENSSSS
jgi:hypothetical protein